MTLLSTPLPELITRAELHIVTVSLNCFVGQCEVLTGHTMSFCDMSESPKRGGISTRLSVEVGRDSNELETFVTVGEYTSPSHYMKRTRNTVTRGN